MIWRGVDKDFIKKYFIFKLQTIYVENYFIITFLIQI